MRLIAILADGRPAESVRLSEPAQGACAAAVQLYRRNGFAPPWISYLAAKDDTVTGTVAFKSAPVNACVEISCFVFPEYTNRGIATDITRRIIDIARAVRPGVVVFAQTENRDSGATVALHRCGLKYCGTFSHPEFGDMWRWEIHTQPGTENPVPSSSSREERPCLSW